MRTQFYSITKFSFCASRVCELDAGDLGAPCAWSAKGWERVIAKGEKRVGAEPDLAVIRVYGAGRPLSLQSTCSRKARQDWSLASDDVWHRICFETEAELAVTFALGHAVELRRGAR